MRINRRSFLAGILGFVASVYCPGLLRLHMPWEGSIFHFTGRVSHDWCDPGNWRPTGVPGRGDTAIIKNGLVDGAQWVDYPLESIVVGPNAAVGIRGPEAGSIRVLNDMPAGSTIDFTHLPPPDR